jgi:hypothetical protein
MTRTRIGIATAAVACLVAAGGGAAAWAHGGKGPEHGKARAVRAAVDPRHGRGLHVVADYLGLTPAQLRADLKSGKTLAQIADATPGKSASGLIQTLIDLAKSKLDKAVSAGKLTSAQEQAILGRLQPFLTTIVNGTHGVMKLPHRALVPGLKEALDYLGLTPAQVLADLASGKTLAQIADSTPGKSASGLIDTLTSVAKARLDKAVAAGKLTSDQEQALLARVTTLVTAVVNGTWPVPHH